MNNKKLFKGALVLFASILMAVSCSAGDKTGNPGDTTHKPGDTDNTKKEIDISLAKDSQKYGDVTKTDKILEATNPTTMESAQKLEVVLDGTDAPNVVTAAKEGKVLVTIKSIAGENTTTWAENSTLTSGISGKKDLSSKSSIPVDAFEVSYKDTTKTLTLTANNKLMTPNGIGGGSLIASANDGGVVKVTVNFKQGTLEKDIDLFVAVKHK